MKEGNCLSYVLLDALNVMTSPDDVRSGLGRRWVGAWIVQYRTTVELEVSEKGATIRSSSEVSQDFFACRAIRTALRCEACFSHSWTSRRSVVAHVRYQERMFDGCTKLLAYLHACVFPRTRSKCLATRGAVNAFE